MQKSIITLSLIALFSYTHAQSTEDVRVNVAVKSVILYLDGAEVSQTKNLSVNAGRTMVIFTGLSPKLISKSIQVNVNNGATVLSVSDKINFLAEQKQSPRVKQMRDSIEMYTDILTQTNYEIDALNKERIMLSKNESIGGQDKGVIIAELKLAADFYRARLKDINSETFKADKKQNKTQEALNKMNNQLNEVIGDAQLPTAEIAVLISSTEKITVDIDLKYVVKESGWVPSYDLISEDINKPIVLKYKAKVYNNSGVDWNDVKMKVSSADPLKNASKPDLACWYLNFSTQNYYGYNNNNNMANNAPSAAYSQQKTIAQEQTLYDEEKQVKGMKGKVKELPKLTEEIQVSELSAEFDIKQNYSIPSDAKPYLIDVTSYNLNASFQYYSVPKVEKEAFMLARIAGWEDLDLIEGQANVYLAGTYVGQSYINTRSVADTLDLSFGRDKKIQITRTKLKENNSEQTAGTTKKVTYTYEIIVKNNHKSAIQIEIEDQLPISQNSEIIVDVKEISKADRNEATGQLKWKLSLAPDETKKILLSFSIKYPKAKAVELKKKARTISAPSF
ncbi:MAG: DUF4139 domain-containing protein [Bacteroidota bacterium]|mgnify:CR=1 FL=1|nr:DUF4139 domain-containing protein [Bacteroidota bacterium]